MDGIAQTETTKTEGGTVTNSAQPEVAGATPAPTTATPATDTPAVEDTATANAEQGGATEGAITTTEEQHENDTAREMNTEQFGKYNETLRLLSRSATAGLKTRYNAFEDAEVKALIKKQVMAGETPDIKSITASVVERHAPTPAPTTEAAATETVSTDTSNELLSLKVENALLKAGIKADRLGAATKLFIAEGADPSKAAEWVKKYPEWGNTESGVTFTQAPPVAGKTAPTPNPQPTLTDFERRVQAARKARGLET